MAEFSNFLATLNGILWHESVLYLVLGTGVLFTLWSGFSQYRALTHGTQVVRGVYDDPNDPGAINHFQALSAALSATVGLGNIGGVALAITPSADRARSSGCGSIGLFGHGAEDHRSHAVDALSQHRGPRQPARRADVGRQQRPRTYESVGSRGSARFSAASSASRC